MKIKASLGLFAAAVLAHQPANAQTFSIDATQREQVRQFYNLVYPASANMSPGWTGNVSNCDPGTITPAYITATLLRVNFYRALAGTPSGITFSNTYNTSAQQAALMMVANNNLNHMPPTSWSCYTTDGANGAGASNLAQGNNGPEAIDAFMYDGGANNTTSGHRRNMLYPATLTMGTGSVPGTNINGNNLQAASALYVLSQGVTPRPATRDPYVAWPVHGYMPYQLMSPRWSFSFPGADFTAATVTITHAGTNIPVSIDSRNNNYGDSAIVWIPNNLSANSGYAWPNPGTDDPWTITVANFTTNGVVGNYTYTTTIFDANVTGAGYQPSVVSGSATPALNQNNAYTFTAVSNATGYEWFSATVTPTNFFDGAENGLGNFTASVSPAYNVITNNVVGAGSNVFCLTDTYITDASAGITPQTLTLNQVIEPNASTQLTFLSDMQYTASLNCNVEVSFDGTTWVPVYTQAGISSGESAFTLKTVSLAAYADKPIQLRFNLVYTGGSYYENFQPVGWFIDNITLTNYSQVTGQVTNIATGLGFNFNPTVAGNYQLSVSPQYFGGYYAPGGPVLHVAAGTNSNTGTNTTTVTRPTLGYAASNSKLTLTWPNTATNFVLQYKTLFSDTNWQTVASGSISNLSGAFSYGVNMTNKSGFFRLATP